MISCPIILNLHILATLSKECYQNYYGKFHFIITLWRISCMIFMITKLHFFPFLFKKKNFTKSTSILCLFTFWLFTYLFSFIFTGSNIEKGDTEEPFDSLSLFNLPKKKVQPKKKSNSKKKQTPKAKKTSEKRPRI